MYSCTTPPAKIVGDLLVCGLFWRCQFSLPQLHIMGGDGVRQPALTHTLSDTLAHTLHKHFVFVSWVTKWTSLRSIDQFACPLHSCTVHTSLQALVTEVQTHSRWLKLRHKTDLHLSLPLPKGWKRVRHSKRADVDQPLNPAGRTPPFWRLTCSYRFFFPSSFFFFSLSLSLPV